MYVEMHRQQDRPKRIKRAKSKGVLPPQIDLGGSRDIQDIDTIGYRVDETGEDNFNKDGSLIRSSFLATLSTRSSITSESTVKSSFTALKTSFLTFPSLLLSSMTKANLDRPSSSTSYHQLQLPSMNLTSPDSSTKLKASLPNGTLFDADEGSLTSETGLDESEDMCEDMDTDGDDGVDETGDDDVDSKNLVKLSATTSPSVTTESTINTPTTPIATPPPSSSTTPATTTSSDTTATLTSRSPQSSSLLSSLTKANSSNRSPTSHPQSPLSSATNLKTTSSVNSTKSEANKLSTNGSHNTPNGTLFGGKHANSNISGSIDCDTDQSSYTQFPLCLSKRIKHQNILPSSSSLSFFASSAMIASKSSSNKVRVNFPLKRFTTNLGLYRSNLHLIILPILFFYLLRTVPTVYAHVDQPCSLFGLCLPLHMYIYCDENKICRCRPETPVVVGPHQCKRNKSYGDKCSTDKECAFSDKNSFCDSHRCSCNANYTYDPYLLECINSTSQHNRSRFHSILTPLAFWIVLPLIAFVISIPCFLTFFFNCVCCCEQSKEKTYQESSIQLRLTDNESNARNEEIALDSMTNATRISMSHESYEPSCPDEAPPSYDEVMRLDPTVPILNSNRTNENALR